MMQDLLEVEWKQYVSLCRQFLLLHGQHLAQIDALKWSFIYASLTSMLRLWVMRNAIHPPHSPSTIFFTLRLLSNRRTLLTDHIELLRCCVRRVHLERPFDIDAWVVLPDHMHAVWSLPPGDSDYGGRWRAIKANFTKGLRKTNLIAPNEWRAAKEVLGHAGIWEPGYQSLRLRSEADRHACMTYCWGNPVKHGLVSEPYEWPYSSIHRDLPRISHAAE